MDEFWLKISGRGKGSLVLDLRSGAPGKFEIVGERWTRISVDSVLSMRGLGSAESRKRLNPDQLSAAFEEARACVARAFAYVRSREKVADDVWEVARYGPKEEKKEGMLARVVAAATGSKPEQPADEKENDGEGMPEESTPAPPAMKPGAPPPGQRLEAKIKAEKAAGASSRVEVKSDSK